MSDFYNKAAWDARNRLSAMDFADNLRAGYLNRKARIMAQYEQQRLYAEELNAQQRCNVLEKEVRALRKKLHDKEVAEELEQLQQANLRLWKKRLARWTLWASSLAITIEWFKLPVHFPIELEQPIAANAWNAPKVIAFINDKYYGKPESSARAALRAAIKGNYDIYWIALQGLIKGGQPFHFDRRDAFHVSLPFSRHLHHNNYAYWWDRSLEKTPEVEREREFLLKNEDMVFVTKAFDMYAWGCALAIQLALFEPDHPLLLNSSKIWEELDEEFDEHFLPKYGHYSASHMAHQAMVFGIYQGTIDFFKRAIQQPTYAGFNRSLKPLYSY